MERASSPLLFVLQHFVVVSKRSCLPNPSLRWIGLWICGRRLTVADLSPPRSVVTIVSEQLVSREVHPIQERTVVISAATEHDVVCNYCVVTLLPP